VNPRRTLQLRLKYGAIAVLLLGGLVALDRLDAFSGINRSLDNAMDATSRLGAVGMFVVALVANLSIIVQIPYTLPLLSAALRGTSLPGMLGLGLAAGLGAGIGVILSYKIADLLLARRPDLARSPMFRWVERNVDRRPGITALVIFLVAATPLPDDTVIVPLATVRYRMRRFALPMFLGKVVHNVVAASLFYTFSSWATRNVSGQAKTDLALGIVVIFLLIVFYQAEKAGFFARSPAAVSDPLPDFEEPGAA